MNTAEEITIVIMIHMGSLKK